MSTEKLLNYIRTKGANDEDFYAGLRLNAVWDHEKFEEYMQLVEEAIWSTYKKEDLPRWLVEHVYGITEAIHHLARTRMDLLDIVGVDVEEEERENFINHQRDRVSAAIHLFFYGFVSGVDRQSDEEKK